MSATDPIVIEDDDDASDEDFNPMIDGDEEEEDEEEEEDGGSDATAFRLGITQRLVNLNDRLEDLAAQVDALTAALDERDQRIAGLRASVRRLSTASAAGRDRHRDNVFVDACRRRFLEGWQGSAEYLRSLDIEHMSFLGHLVDIPSVKEKSD